MRGFLCLALAAAIACTAFAQLDPPKPNPLVGARSLALSPDGKRIAFSYQGDIWVVPSSGGKAVPVTNNIEMEDNPVWSPDGLWIAFASNRNGNNDIYVVPADGGESRRLTWHTGSDVPSDWSPDGKTIIERAVRDDPNNGFYAIDVRTGRTNQIMLDMMTVGSPHFAPDGKSIVYTRFGFPWVRARYQGSAASQLWRFDLADYKRVKIRSNGFQHLWPNTNATDGTVFAVTVVEKTPSSSPVDHPIPKNVDNVNRTPNVYAINPDGTAKRLTDFVGTPVRFLTAARSANIVAFEDDGDVYTLTPGEKPQRVSIVASIDDKTVQEEREVLTTGADEASFSPKGDKVVVQVRGDLWLVPVKKEGKSPNKDDAVQLTNWAGEDINPLWCPDNKTVFFVSDRDGAERLFRLNTETKEISPVTKDDDDVSELQLTPDKQKVSFWRNGKEGGLYTVLVSGGEPSLVFSHPGQAKYYAWSPDSRYVAYSETLLRSGYYFWDSGENIFLYDLVNKTKTDVTQLNASQVVPVFTPDGKYLLFRSNRSGDGLYQLSLTRDISRDADTDLKYEKPAGPVKVEVELDGIEQRVRKIAPQAPDDPVLIDFEKGDLYFIVDGDVWKTAYSGDEPHKITTGAGFTSIKFSDDGKSIVGVRSGMPVTMDFKAPNSPVTVITFRADWAHDLRKEHAAAYNEFWRVYNREFYDPNFHARDWKVLGERYKKLLPSVGHRNEMATVLNELVGELESSHSEVSPAAGNPKSETSAHPGFTFDYSYTGPGIKILDVPPHSPGSYDKTRLYPGEVVRKINGVEVKPDEALWRDVLNEQVGRDISLTVEGKDGKTTEVKYRALSAGEFSQIIGDNRLEARRKHVEQVSEGKLTYVHIAGMGPAELQKFQQQVWMYTDGKKGLIIDVRNNGGGNTSDQIIGILEHQPNAIYKVRDEETQFGPGQAFVGPMVVMMAETSYSNAEMFPTSMKTRKLATLVGRPTPGYVIYTGGRRLVDGTIMRVPGTGVYRVDGSPLENNATVPDYDVDITPEEYFAGQDPQLDKAIDVLMKQIHN